MAIEFKKYDNKAYQKYLEKYKKDGSKDKKLPPHLAQFVDDKGNLTPDLEKKMKQFNKNRRIHKKLVKKRFRR